MKAKELKAQLDAKEAETDAIKVQITDLTARLEITRQEYVTLRGEYIKIELAEKQAAWKPTRKQQIILDRMNAGEVIEITENWRSERSSYWFSKPRETVSAASIQTMERLQAVKCVSRGYHDRYLTLTDYGKSKAKVPQGA